MDLLKIRIRKSVPNLSKSKISHEKELSRTPSESAPTEIILTAISKTNVFKRTTLSLCFCFQKSTDFKVNFDDSLIRNYEEMVDIVKNKKAQIIDARTVTSATVIDRKIFRVSPSIKV